MKEIGVISEDDESYLHFEMTKEEFLLLFQNE